MLLKIEFCTQPRLSVHTENCFRSSTNSSTNTTVGLKMKRLISKSLPLKGTKQAIILFLFQLPFNIFYEVSVFPNETRIARKAIILLLEHSMRNLFNGIVEKTSSIGHSNLPGLLLLLQLLRQRKAKLLKI